MQEVLFNDPKDFLKLEFDLRRTRNVAYSMRAFARDIKVSPSSLAEFMNGQSGISAKRAEAICKTLKWSPERSEFFVTLIRSHFEKDRNLRVAAQIQIQNHLNKGSGAISLDAFKLMSDWYHLAILELLDMNEEFSIPQIAEKLEVEVENVQGAIDRLLHFKLIKKTNRGYLPTELTSHFGDKGSSEAIRHFHFQMLQKAVTALDNLNLNERDFCTHIFSIRKADLPNLTKDLQKATLLVLSKYTQPDKKSLLMSFGTQLIPICKPDLS